MRKVKAIFQKHSDDRYWLYKWIITTILLIIGGSAVADHCATKTYGYGGQIFFNECTCKNRYYPKVEAVMKPLGIKTLAGTLTRIEADGESWYLCAVELEWEKYPENEETCVKKKREAKKLIQEFLNDQTIPGFNSSLVCFFP